jgi:hypothetical protein
MSNTHLIARLVQENVSPQLIADLAMALARGEASEQQAAERRAKDRARKSIPRNSTETAEIQDDPSPLDKETLPPTPPIKEIISPTREGGDALPRKAGGFSAPDGVKHETWVAFCQQRKKSLTRIAFDRIQKTIGEAGEVGWPPGELFERAIERGYETIFIPSEKRHGNRPANDRHDELVNSMVRAAARAEDRSVNRGMGF